jgi:hypothetical protein
MMALAAAQALAPNRRQELHRRAVVQHVRRRERRPEIDRHRMALVGANAPPSG